MSLSWVRPLVAVTLPLAIAGWAVWRRLRPQLPPDPAYQRPRLAPPRTHVRPVPPRIYDWATSRELDLATTTRKGNP